MPTAAVISSIYFVLLCARDSADVPVSSHCSFQISREELRSQTACTSIPPSPPAGFWLSQFPHLSNGDDGSPYLTGLKAQ